MRTSPDQRTRPSLAINRRTLLVGGSAGAGLLLAWGLWPRDYRPNLPVAGNETLINAFLKIDTAGQIIVVVPQLEMGQGVTTVLPQILADELGADWRTVAVQGAPISPLYANELLASAFLEGDWTRLLGGAGQWAVRQYAQREAMMLTGGATSVRAFAQRYREAGAAARVLLCKAAAARWDAQWESCDIVDGFVTDGQHRLRIGELAAEAVGFALPDAIPERNDGGDAGDDGDGGSDAGAGPAPGGTGGGRLLGRSVPRLDLPSKIDGSHNYAADIRLPGMAFAAIRQGPIGARRLLSSRDAEAAKVTGHIGVVKQEAGPGHGPWVAVAATNWWAANKALDALAPVFEVAAPPFDSRMIDRALDAALNDEDRRHRFYAEGDIGARFAGAHLLRATYDVAPALHLAIEPPCATARVADGRAEIWVASQAPAFCRRAVARALDLAEDAVMLYPVSAGGSFDRRMEHDAAVQAALIARALGRPVQLLYSRLEEVLSDRPRAPARARMTAKLAAGGRIEALSVKVATPAADAQTWARVADGAAPDRAALGAGAAPSRMALSGLPSFYAVADFAVDHHPVSLPLPLGRWRGQADSYTAFFTESFMDELAYKAGIEPLSFRMEHLSDQPRLAHCLTVAAAMGGWQGGVPGSGQGLACHAMDGGCIAVMIEASLESGGVRVPHIVAVADLGDQPHPDIARQQIEGGLIFGLAAALGGDIAWRGGLPTRALMGRMGLPRLADIGDVTIELVERRDEPAGVGQIGVPAVAPALAGALFTLTGRRARRLPLVTQA